MVEKVKNLESPFLEMGGKKWIILESPVREM